jgi:hypothetical protein
MWPLRRMRKRDEDSGYKWPYILKSGVDALLSRDTRHEEKAGEGPSVASRRRITADSTSAHCFPIRVIEGVAPSDQPGFSYADDTRPHESFTASNKMYRVSRTEHACLSRLLFFLSTEREKEIYTQVIPESLSSSTAVVSLSVLPHGRALIANWKCKTACNDRGNIFRAFVLFGLFFFSPR